MEIGDANVLVLSENEVGSAASAPNAAARVQAAVSVLAVMVKGRQWVISCDGRCCATFR